MVQTFTDRIQPSNYKYECTVCKCHKKPKETGKTIHNETIFACPKCHHKGSFDDFLPTDMSGYFFT